MQPKMSLMNPNGLRRSAWRLVAGARNHLYRTRLHYTRDRQ